MIVGLTLSSIGVAPKYWSWVVRLKNSGTSTSGSGSSSSAARHAIHAGRASGKVHERIRSWSGRSEPLPSDLREADLLLLHIRHQIFSKGTVCSFMMPQRVPS
jgi:hypothetical protein